MTKQNKSRNSNRKSKNSTQVSAFETRCRAQVTPISGSLYINATTVSGANVYGLNPTVLGTLFSPSLLALANCFTEYRFTKIMFRCFPSGSNAYALAYTPEVQSVPITLTNALQSPYSILVPGPASSMVPLDLTLTRSVLFSGAAKWYKCVQSATADDWDELQGQVDIVATSGAALQIEMYYDIELTGLANTPTNLDEVVRRSLVTDDIRAIDLVVPGRPFVKGKSLDAEWIRVKAIGEREDLPAKREIARLMAL